MGSHILEWFGVHYLNGLIYMENLPPLPFAVLLFIIELSDPHLVPQGALIARDPPQAQLKFSHLWPFPLCSSVLITEAPAQETEGAAC